MIVPSLMRPTKLQAMAKQPEETGLIQKYLAPLAGPAGLGLADDAACFTPPPGTDLVITTDTIVEGVHFLSANTPYQVAIKAITVNLSDLVAKGADPLGYQLALSLPQKPKEAWIADFASGLAEQANGKLLGGDITVSKGGPLTISVTAIGAVPSGRMVRRDGAKIGDDIHLCGPIGTSAAGLKAALDLPWAKRTGLSAADIGELLFTYAAPMVAFSDDYAARIRDHASASLDVSDGLAIDLDRLCSASGVGAKIMVEQIPLNPVVARLVASGDLSMQDVITGGDDYVALIAAPPSARQALSRGPLGRCHRIGRIVSAGEGVTYSYEDGSSLVLGRRKGYDHFSQN